MSFIAGYLAGLGEGSSDYRNETVTFKVNGEYKPGENVRWDGVTVDVPQVTLGIMKTIDELPVHASLELADGYRIDFSIDLEDVVPVQSMKAEWSYWFPRGGGDITIYPSWRQTVLTCFAKIYKDGRLLFAMPRTTDGFEYNKQQNYTAYDGQPLYMSSEVFISDISNMTVEFSMPDARSSVRVVLNYKYKKNWYSYDSGGLYDVSVNDKSDKVYFYDITAYNTYPGIITDLDLNGKAKALIGLHAAFIHTMGYEIRFDISNV